MINGLSLKPVAEHEHLESLKIIAALKACSKCRDLATGARIHSRVQEQLGSAPSIYVWNSLIDMYSKCGSMSQARQVFDTMQARNVASWNTVIRGYAQNGSPALALDLFQRMNNHGFAPDARTYVAALIACTGLKLLDKGEEIHSKLKLTSEADNLYVANSLLEMYARCGSMQQAHSVFSGLRERTSASWSSLVSGYVQSGQPLLALHIFLLMLQDGFLPDSRSLVSVLKSCIALADLRRGGHIHNELVDGRHELLSDVFVATTLVDMYAKSGDMPRARKVFEEMQRHDAVSWTALLMGYVENGEEELALKLFLEQMQVQPEAPMYIAAFKACASLRSVERGRDIHARAEAEGYVTSDVFVATAVVNMYGKSGCMAEARAVFDKTASRHRDTVLWTAIMLGYVENRQGRVALQLFSQMQSEGVQADSQTVVTALNACSSLPEEELERGTDAWLLQKGVEIHREAARTGLDQSDSYVANSLIDMYSSCGCLDRAEEIFNRMSARTLVSWNTMISSYTRNGSPELALELFARMQVEPDARSYLAAVNACAKLGCLERGREIHKEVTEAGYDCNSYVAGALVNMYVKCGNLCTAREILYSEPVNPNLFAWTCMVSGFADDGQSELALQTFVDACSITLPDSRMLVAAVKACSVGAAAATSTAAKSVLLERGMWLHGLSRELGFHEQTDPFLASSLVDMYTKCDSLEDGLKVFETCVREGNRTPVVVWNSMIMGYVVLAMHTSALGLFTRMLSLSESEEMEPNANTFVAALGACSGLGKVAGSLETGMALHSEAVKRQLQSEVSVGNSLVDMYSRCGSLEDAHRHLRTLPKQDVHLQTWNSLLTGHALAEQGDVALEIFHGMQRRDNRTYVGALKACVFGGGGLIAGKVVHWIACREEPLDGAGLVPASLIDMYSKSGSMVDAQQVFDTESRNNNLVAWNSLMGGYSHNGDVTAVLKLFNSLKQEEIQGDGITFLCLLSACAYAGLVEKGVMYLREMDLRYGVSPRIEHFTCVIDLLGRANQLDAAVEVIESLPLQADSRAWRAMLAACVKWKNQRIAKLAFESIVALSDGDQDGVASAYVLLANLSGQSGQSEALNPKPSRLS